MPVGDVESVNQLNGFDFNNNEDRHIALSLAKTSVAESAFSSSSRCGFFTCSNQPAQGSV
jgi:hypothetical protein